MEKNKIKGKVIKIVSGRYWVKSDSEVYVCSARGRLRRAEGIYVGDYVICNIGQKAMSIEKVVERKNSLIRPPIANVDIVIITVANEPKPDLLLVDKIIVNAYAQRIEPILCYNKIDLASEDEIVSVLSQYDTFIKTFRVSSETKEGFDELEKYLEGKTSCLAGQSAVGKTSIINAILDLELETAGLSKKISRGKHTTRHLEIYEIHNAEIIDTCGFSVLEYTDIIETELALYYPDFLELARKCAFTNCTHTREPNCAVFNEAKNNVALKDRYERYLRFYEEIKALREKY
ncbi:MAG TPA: ribosome small subunit-dependent GTPase A [Clostridia bacterium]|jgi:ribosome biogenesis GTPase|nr:ribosome small subunit-dependent GTPase A [Clostridia bacterium]